MPPNRNTPARNAHRFNAMSTPPAFLLWKQDPELAQGGKVNARTIVNNRIRDMVTALAGSAPSKIRLPHHEGHAVLDPLICVGHNDYTHIGQYYVRCAGKSVGCTKATKYIGQRLDDDVLFGHPELTPLLLMREELLPTPHSTGMTLRSGPSNRGSGLSMSPRYREVAEFFYGPQSPFKPSLPASLPSTPTHQPNAPIDHTVTFDLAGIELSEDDSDFELPISPFELPRNGGGSKSSGSDAKAIEISNNRAPATKTYASEVIEFDSDGEIMTKIKVDSDNEAAGLKAKVSRVTEIIEIDSDSEDGKVLKVGRDGNSEHIYGSSMIFDSDSDEDIAESRTTVAFFLIFWTKNESRFIEVLLLAPRGRTFKLQDYAGELSFKNIDTGRRIETYNPTSGMWVPLDWTQRIGPLNSEGRSFLVRYDGITHAGLLGFDGLVGLAESSGQLQGLKGKSRAD